MRAAAPGAPPVPCACMMLLMLWRHAGVGTLLGAGSVFFVPRHHTDPSRNRQRGFRLPQLTRPSACMLISWWWDRLTHGNAGVGKGDAVGWQFLMACSGGDTGAMQGMCRAG